MLKSPTPTATPTDTPRLSARRERLRVLDAAVADLQRRITAAVSADYPALCGYLMWSRPRRRDRGSDSWSLDDRLQPRLRYARRWLRDAVGVAVGRISEAYGTGEGGAWARRHGLPDPDPASECNAERQVLRSLRLVARGR